MGANQAANTAIFVLKSTAPMGRSYAGFALTIKVIGGQVARVDSIDKFSV
jgi:hypothetical protein